MTTHQPKKKRAREKQARKEHRLQDAAAPGGTSGPIDRDVDESPAAVEERREAQSGPGATGVPHTGEHASDHVEDEQAARPSTDHSDDESADDVSLDPDDLREPERDKIDPHTRHER